MKLSPHLLMFKCPYNQNSLNEIFHLFIKYKYKYFILQETSVLRGKLLEQANLVLYADKHKAELLDAASSSSSDPSSSSSSSSSSVPRRGPSNWSEFSSPTIFFFFFFFGKGGHNLR
ncbi:hypothetical protein HanOQP8_Chr09g0335731 [Helianthus annuus]|nr:hypothetical protein HanOQP8_Chr09g0335731 [Helianthus annuus]